MKNSLRFTEKHSAEKINRKGLCSFSKTRKSIDKKRTSFLFLSQSNNENNSEQTINKNTLIVLMVSQHLY